METLIAPSIQKMLIPNNTFKLVDSCRSSMKDRREVLTYLHVKTEGLIEATDGIILVQCKLESGILPGVYRILAVNKYSKTMTELTLETFDVKFPETDHVIPKETDETIDILVNKKEVHAVTIIKLYEFTGSIVSEKYLETIGELNTTWKVSKTEKDKALMFYSDAYETRIVLMPLAK